MKRSFIKVILISGFVLILFSCAPKADIFVQDSGDLILTLNIIPGKTTEQIIHKFMEFSESERNDSIFNVEEIRESLKKENINVLDIKTESLAGINAKLKFKQENQSMSELFTLDKEKGRLACKITSANIKEFVSMLSDEDREYFDLLMAPILTGENLNSAEYEELISAAYGETLAKDLRKSLFTISFQFPKKVSKASIKPFGRLNTNDSKVTAEIKLTDLLTIKDSINIEINYGK